MNKWRAAGLFVIAALVVLLLMLRDRGPSEEVVETSPPPPREVFHASKPLRVVVTAQQADSDVTWLDRELRNLLLRGRMRLAAEGPQKAASFTLRVELAQDPQSQARIDLLAPDGIAERSITIDLDPQQRLAIVQEFARQLPSLLQAAPAPADWTAFAGTRDPGAYEKLLLSAGELLDSAGTGFTQPSAATQPYTVDRLEALTRAQPDFARAWALLALAYLNLGGEDEASLTQIAAARAQRAVTLDAELADAQSALGLTSLRRGEWLTATEHFSAALALDADALPALEGLACLLTDAGQTTAAMPIASRAVALQAGNVGANECLAYARLASGQSAGIASSTATESDAALAAITPDSHIPEVARVQALAAVLSGDIDGAQRGLRGADTRPNTDPWIEPLLQAATDKRHTSAALQAITLAASNRAMDPATEILGGAALRQSEFVFNRMLRLQKQNQPIPLRVLWLPQTEFLRRHSRFPRLISTAGLLPFWQEHGLPDVCASEPQVYGCKRGNKRP